MATSNGRLTTAEVRDQLTSGVVPDAFAVVDHVATLMGDPLEESVARELLIRIYASPEPFEPVSSIVADLARSLGLFPYLDPQQLSISSLLAYEAHRPLDYDNEHVVFHSAQASVYRHLMDRRSVILSAPTSFGKSLVLDAVAASGRFDNIVVIVPTIALIDETRRRLARLGSTYKIITHPEQPLSMRNILIMTQERFLDLQELPPVDLFMIDEFYKLDLGFQSDFDRSVLLNQALRRLLRTGAPFYLAGPNISAMAEVLPQNITAAFVSTDFSTVAVDVISLPRPSRKEELPALVELLKDLQGESTLVYCRSPARTRQIARALLEEGYSGATSDSLHAASLWVADQYHPDWLVADAIRQGIGIHHGKIPRALAQFQVEAFNKGALRLLLCTSTLIEGVNTAAENVVVFDDTINQQKLDYFTYSNIKGRSGRMMRHFLGRVYTYREPPELDDAIVDIPLYSQGPETPLSLLVQLDRGELTGGSWDRVQGIHQQVDVPLETIRQNTGIDPQAQLAAARSLSTETRTRPDLFAWTGYPTYDQLRAVLEIAIRHLAPIQRRRAGVSSANQLTYKLMMMSASGGGVTKLIENELTHGGPRVAGDPDAAVEAALDFAGTWPGHEVPRLLSAMHRLTQPILQEDDRNCDYTMYASAVQNWFLPPHFVTCEEYGIPFQVLSKLRRRLPGEASLDELLTAISRLPADLPELTDFERELLERSLRDL